MGSSFSIINLTQLREDLKRWKVREVSEALQLSPEKVDILRPLLHDKDNIVVENTLFIIEKLIKRKALKEDEVDELLDDIITLTRSSNEKIALRGMKCLRTILEDVNLSDDSYNKIIATLTNVITTKKGILREYAAEELGIIGAKITTLIKKVINFLVSLVRESKDREVKEAALTALTEIASRSKDKNVIEGIAKEIRDVLKREQDSEVRKKALSSLEIILTKKKDEISSETLSDIQSEVPEVLPTKNHEISIQDIEKLFALEKHEIVAEIAKENEDVQNAIIDMLSSEDYLKRADALWVIYRILRFIPSEKLGNIFSKLKTLVKDKNPWIHNSAIKTLAELYLLFPEVRRDILTFLDSLLKSEEEEEVKIGLEIIRELLAYTNDVEIFKATLLITLRRLKENKIRLVILRFYASTAEYFTKIERELIEATIKELDQIYKMSSKEERRIILSLMDLLATILERAGK